MVLEGTQNVYSNLGTNALSDNLSSDLVITPRQLTHTEHIRPTMALGHHLFPTSVFRLQNLDLISNHCPGLTVMQKSELFLTHGKNLVVGMLSNVQCRRNQHSP